MTSLPAIGQGIASGLLSVLKLIGRLAHGLCFQVLLWCGGFICGLARLVSGLIFLTLVLCIIITPNRTDIMGPLAGSSFTCFMIAALYEELVAFIDPGRWY